MEKTNISINSFINFFLEILFPSRCIGCNTKNQELCQNCINKLQTTSGQTENNITALYDYKDPLVKKIIWELKYHNSPRLGKKLGQILYRELLEEISLLQILSSGSPIYIIPVPISKNRKQTRGYNQSEIIARSFCKENNFGDFEIKNNIVFKKINTIPQAKLTNKNKRLKNIKGVFDIKNTEQIKGKTIIIIDDVTTTGGTIMEIIKVLKKNGAKKVVGFAFAH